MTKTRAVVVAIPHPTEDGLFLHGFRPEDNKWSLPAGRLIPGETPHEAARRELKEETGMHNVELEDKVHDYPFQNEHIHLIFGKAPADMQLNSSNDPDQEFSHFKWINPLSQSNLRPNRAKNALVIHLSKKPKESPKDINPIDPIMNPAIHNKRPRTDENQKIYEAKVQAAMKRLGHIKKSIVDLAKNAPLQFSLNSNRAREVRDLIQANGGKMASADLKRKGYNLSDYKMGHLVDPQGNVSAESLQSHIDSLPKTQWISTDSQFGHDVSHLPEEQQHKEVTNQFLQRHSPEQSKLVQFHATPEMLQRMQEAGVYDTFTKFNQAAEASGHPSSKHQIGWVRYTKGNDGHIHVDEIQTDHPKNFEDLYHKQKMNIKHVLSWSPEKAKLAIKYHPMGQHIKGLRQRYTPEMLDQMDPQLRQQTAAQFGEPEHAAIIHNILFGNQKPNQLIHEAFLQHMRNAGHTGSNISLWTPQSKAKLSLDNPDEPIPGHMMETYDNQPSKMGYKPSKYGDVQTQKNPTLTGLDTQTMPLRKKA